MDTNKRFDETVSQWLEETAPARLPERVLNSTFERTRKTKQLVGWRAVVRRFDMHRLLPALGSATVVVVVLIIGAVYVVPNLNLPGIGGQPSPTPSPTASPSATSSPTAAPSPTAIETPDQWGCINNPAGGTYRRSVGTISVTATVPAEWRGGADAFYLVNTSCLFSASLELKVALIRAVPSDACDWRLTGVETATPAAVTAALAAQTGHETIGPTDTTVGGYPASRFDFTTQADLDLETCDEGLRLTGGSEGEEFGGPDRDETITMYVVDVDGLAVGVYERRLTDATPAQIAELDALVASLRFEP